jgi:hypothetical protein
MDLAAQGKERRQQKQDEDRKGRTSFNIKEYI